MVAAPPRNSFPTKSLVAITQPGTELKLYQRLILLAASAAGRAEGGAEGSPFAAGIRGELHVGFSTFMSSVTQYVDLFMLNWNM